MASKPRAPDADSINVELLPEGLRDLVQVLGFTAAIRLVQCRGGTPLRVPLSLDLSNPSEAVLRLMDEIGGYEPVKRLVDWRGGETINYLPKYDAVARQLRHAHVRELRNKGLPLNAIAAQTNYSRRWIVEVLGLEVDDRQGDLFATPAAKPSEAAPTTPQHSAHNPFAVSIVRYAQAQQDDD